MQSGNDHDRRLPVRGLEGRKKSLRDYRGKVLLLVNATSECSLTPRFEGIRKLHEKYAAKGRAIIGFPCNRFANHDPGRDAEIREFCQLKFDVRFPIFAKLKVNGAGADSLA